MESASYVDSTNLDGATSSSGNTNAAASGSHSSSSSSSASSSSHLGVPTRYTTTHQPAIASPLRASMASQHVSSGSEEATPTQSPCESYVDLKNPANGQQGRLAGGASMMASRAQSYLESWKEGGTSQTLPLHHSPQRHSNNESTSYFSSMPSDPTSMPSEASSQSHYATGSGTTPRWTVPTNASSRSTLTPFDADPRADMTTADARKPSFGSSSGVGGMVVQGTVGGGGYASSVDADFYSAPPSRLVSRTPTPVSHVPGVARLSSPDIVESTESDEEDSDYYVGTPSSWSATLFGLNSNKAGSNFGKFGRSSSKHDYHTLGTRRGSKWKETEPDSAFTYAGPRSSKYRTSSGKGYERSSSLSALASSTAPDVRRRNRRRRQGAPNVPLPLRVVASLISKTFRTCFGPIHPLTIMIALVLIAGFVTSVTMLIIYILNPDKEPLPWRTHCQQQMPFPHTYADALAPVNVMVGVMTIDSKYERRNVIRNTYARHTLPTDVNGRPLGNVQVKFVLGRVRKAHAARIALEMEAYNDIVVLNIDETQSARKTHAYMQWAAENATVPFLRPLGPAKGYNGSVTDTFLPSANAPGGLTNYEYEHTAIDDAGREAEGEKMRYQVAWKKVDYVVKADDDSFIVLDELERHLRVAPRTMTYWGYLIKNWFMGGEAYALSFDLVRWIAHSSDTARTAKGKEDTRTPQWLAMHPNRSSINWVSEHCWIYDHPKAGSPYSHGYLFPDYVEKIKVEARRGLSEQEIAYRGGERRSQSYSTVSKWHHKYFAPRRDLTVEEEVEALVEGGGRWKGTWVRGADGSSSETWVPYRDIVYQADDERLRPSATNERGSAVLASDVGLEPYSGLPIYGPVDRGNLVNSTVPLSSEEPPRNASASDEATIPTPVESGAVQMTESDVASKLGQQRRNLLSELTSFPRKLLGKTRDEHQDDEQDSTTPLYRTSGRVVARPTPKDGYGEYASLRSRRYLNRPHGGTVVVHYLKKTEWWMETALVLLGKPKLWTNGAGGLGKEWRMGGSPLVRADGYISEGRSAPRQAIGSLAPADDGEYVDESSKKPIDDEEKTVKTADSRKAGSKIMAPNANTPFNAP